MMTATSKMKLSKHKMTPVTSTMPVISNEVVRLSRMESDDSFCAFDSGGEWATDVLDESSEKEEVSANNITIRGKSLRHSHQLVKTSVKPSIRQVSGSGAEWFDVSQERKAGKHLKGHEKLNSDSWHDTRSTRSSDKSHQKNQHEIDKIVPRTKENSKRLSSESESEPSERKNKSSNPAKTKSKNKPSIETDGDARTRIKSSNRHSDDHHSAHLLDNDFDDYAHKDYRSHGDRYEEECIKRRYRQNKEESHQFSRRLNGISSEEYSKPRREKSLEDMMSSNAAYSTESDREDGSVISKTRQTSRRGRPTRRQSAACGPCDRSLSRSSHGMGMDRSLSQSRRRASVAVGGVEEIRARSLSRTRRRGSMNTALQPARNPERSMLGEHSDSEKNDDDDLDYELQKRREILNQSRRGPILSDALRNQNHFQDGARESDPQRKENGCHHDESSELSLSSSNSPQRSRNPIQVSSEDWERGLDDVLNRRHAARDGSLGTASEIVSQEDQRQILVDDKKFDVRKGSNAAVAVSGPKIDLTKLTVPIASPQKKKGWGSRLHHLGTKGKERKNVV